MGRKPVYTFAQWRVKDGQLAAVLGLLAELMAKSTAEEGSLLERNRVAPYPAYGIAVEKFMLLSSSRKSELSSNSEFVSVKSRVGEHGYRITPAQHTGLQHDAKTTSCQTTEEQLTPVKV